MQKLGMRDKVAPVYAGGKTLPILSPAQKRECAKLREGGMTWTDIAKRFGVHRNTVRRAVVGRSMDDR